MTGKVLGVGGFGITYLCYDLTLKTAHCIELDDIMQFMTEHKEIIRAEGVPVA